MWRNDERRFGLVALAFHWLTAVNVIALFALGLWMVELTYYDPWYQTGPNIHRSVGVLLFALVAVRLAWRFLNPPPPDDPGLSALERRAAHAAHWALYLLLFAVIVSGYLISSADGRAVEVFGWFGVPATLSGIEQQEDIAGDIHRWLAWILVGLAGIHALAALKHHFIDRDRTLRRMLGLRR